jgi:hypothetical protein
MQRLIQRPISTRRNVFYIAERLSQEDSDKHFELFTYVPDGFYKNSMELSASSEASSRSADREFPRPSIALNGSLPCSAAVMYGIRTFTQSLQLNGDLTLSNMFTLSAVKQSDDSAVAPYRQPRYKYRRAYGSILTFTQSLQLNSATIRLWHRIDRRAYGSTGALDASFGKEIITRMCRLRW